MLNEAQVVSLIDTVTVEELRGWVTAGWIAPAHSQSGLVFDELDIARVRLVCELRSELAVPEDAVPLVLSLLDQVHGLRRELRSLGEAVDAQPDHIRTAVLSVYRQRSED